MRLGFHGAVGGVTGSCYLLECGARRVLLECGLVQGGDDARQANRAPFPVPAGSLDAVVLSHAHIDHSGRIPMLVAAGYDGPIYTHRATVDLCDIMLRDAAYLQEKDSETENRKRARRGLRRLKPLYTMRDAERALRQFRPLAYDARTEILPGIELRLRDAGHILGSAIVELWLREQDRSRKVVFSGDLGLRGTPILRDPAVVEEADAVLLESTYGDRLHRSRDDSIAELGEVFAAAHAEGGNILIPAFAVGRTQELLYQFARHYDDWGLDHWRICLDSPMAIRATEVYGKHEELYDRETLQLQREAGLRLAAKLEMIRTPQQSRALNRARSGLVIIAASGMCEGGRVRHHLKNLLWRPRTHVIIVGFQARGTTGRKLVDGAAYVSLWGEPVRVKATVHTLGGFSAHADQQGLVDWYRAIRGSPPVWLVHGEDEARAALGRQLRRAAGARVTLPGPGDMIELERLRRA
ncbi:MBL fold metallo-hydrolase [Thioalkalivibrio sp. XN8]|uniref:MBL fold metallo-hydrolase RNA specificity domain-containing protein n=1 Tax=Thioalkalivibrio sp. XN8 TaxID=2712863 RepID=UPI0013EA6C77|nr:MBL fold metallo-hydrolase [Thioalkalivibrio sp. XN8]NGP54779.1 MBL fold metallo-hydrolase [Thioalkalivibrio sp. XN8]